MDQFDADDATEPAMPLQPSDRAEGADVGDAVGGDSPAKSAARRRGSRGGQRRRGASSSPGANDPSDELGNDEPADETAADERYDDAYANSPAESTDDSPGDDSAGDSPGHDSAGDSSAGDDSALSGANDVELPKPMSEGRPSVEAAERALVRRPQIGDTMPMPASLPQRAEGRGGVGARVGGATTPSSSTQKRRKRRGTGGGTTAGGGGSERGERQRSDDEPLRAQGGSTDVSAPNELGRGGESPKKARRGRGGRDKGGSTGDGMNAAMLDQRRGRERNGKPIGRYFMAVQVRTGMAQVAVLEGRSLIEHYVSRPADDVSQIHGNIYVGRVQNVLPGMEAAFVDIATPKNAVLYRGDVQYDAEDIVENAKNARIEDILRNKQLIICQVTKNPIGHKGARLTQEVSLPGRYVVLIPNSSTYGISKRLPDDVRKRLRGILDRVKPAEHGLIVRTAAEAATEEELVADMTILLGQWDEIAAKAARAQRPTLLYREPELAVRVIREEFNADYRGVVIDDERLFHDVRKYVAAFNPDLADRIEYYDAEANGLSLYEHHHVHEQIHKALDRKVWLPSGGSLIIEHTEALTVIDVNTGKNVGSSNLEATVFHNNMEAAVEIAKQLRLRDIGGIIVIDFIDMEIRDNRAKVVEAFRNALARDKTRSQIFDISELGLVEMTRKRIGEGLLREYSEECPECQGRGVKIDYDLLE
jgi:ribonuclease E